MRFDNVDLCIYCTSNVDVYLAGKTLAKINDRTLPAWKKCRCGWNEISTSELTDLVPAWRDLFNEDEEDISLDEAIQGLKEFVEERFGENV